MPIRLVDANQPINATFIGGGSVWHNPYTHRPGPLVRPDYLVGTPEEAQEKYREYLSDKWQTDAFFRLCLTGMVQEYLRGDDIVLSCRCGSPHCHGYVLMDVIKWVAKLQIISLEDDQPF